MADKFDTGALEPFKNKSIKKLITVFGYRFSSIIINRDNKNIQVPIEFANKEKYIRALETGISIDASFPRMLFEVTGFTPNTERNDNQNNVMKCINSDGEVAFVNSPAWFDLDITMTVVSLNMDDGLQIVESIVTAFRPAENWQIIMLPEINRIENVPVTLLSATLTDNWEGSLEDRRYVEWRLVFKASLPIYGNVYTNNEKKIILNSQGSSGDNQTNIIYDVKNGTIIEEVKTLDKVNIL